MFSFAARVETPLRKIFLAKSLNFHSYRFRKIHNVPFQDDLTPIDDDIFNLQDFQQYKEAPDVLALKRKLGIPIDYGGLEAEFPMLNQKKNGKNLPADLKTLSLNKESLVPVSSMEESTKATNLVTFQDFCKAKEPVVFVSKLLDPFLNLAIEDYIFSTMSVPSKSETNCNRLLFYTNTPCVVIGKNQNPWKEVNVPLLTDLRLPLVRRRSGGGTVVHDLGNVNYSFMTTRDSFDRFTFANLVKDAVNRLASTQKQVMVNDRGDIITKHDAKKVSGSAYKISRDKSYHHGTMLLNLKLDVLRQLLHRDSSKLGVVSTVAAVSSVKSPVTNLEISSDEFIEAVTDQFENSYGVRTRSDQEKVGSIASGYNQTQSQTFSQDFGQNFSQNFAEDADEIDQTELLGLGDFIEAFSPKSCPSFEIDASCELPQEILKTKDELMKWDWKFGSTPKFLHSLEHPGRDLRVVIEVGPKAQITDVTIEGPSEAVESFKFLKQVIENGQSVTYTGSNVAGYVLDDELSDWIGTAIDGTS